MMPTVLDTFPWLATWLSTATPLLPGLTLARWAQPVLWGLVTAGVVAHGLAGRRPGVRRGAMLLALCWMLLPGAWSPAWWLGLAFQLPSDVTVLACACLVWAGWRGGADPVSEPAALPLTPQSTFSGLKALGLVMGALLLADMFILLPFSLYHWGFSSFAFGTLLAVALLSWVAARNDTQRHDAQRVSAALALFALTRLPSGNVFDAVIDPWLWLVLLVGTLRQALRRTKSRL